MTAADVANYVPEGPDKRSEQDWLAMSLEELRAEWARGPRFDRPPYPIDQNRFRRLTRVRSEIFARTNGKPPDGLTYGARAKAS